MNQIPQTSGAHPGDSITDPGPKLRTVIVKVVAMPPRGYRYSVATSTVDVGAGRQGFITTRESGTKQTRAEAWDTATNIIRTIAMEDGL